MRLRSRLVDRVEQSFVLRRIARRAGRRPPTLRTHPLERPIGGKFELTYSCNLRCDFCYTDSPRRTLERATDLPDDAWERVVDEAIALGIVEAVVSGGEPLLRPELTVRLLERLDEAGVAVSLNTNGWFVDDALADRLARLPRLSVHISLDGATPAVHDAARGVPGSWRRAVRAIGLLLERGVTVTASHVVTPLNEGGVDALLEVVWRLGVGLVRITPVIPVGAASREVGWDVDRLRLRRTVATAAERYGDDFEIKLQSGTADQVAYHDVRAPGTFLVRPDGAVRVDALTPFSFGRAQDGLAACWATVRARWDSDEVVTWVRSIRSTKDLGRGSLVPYVDDEISAGGTRARVARATRRLAPRLPRRTASSTVAAPDLGDVDGARAHATEWALARRLRIAPLRWAGDSDGVRVVRLTDTGHAIRLSANAGVILDHLDGRPVGDAVDALAARFPDAGRQRIERDVIATVRWLCDREVLQPDPATPATPAAAATPLVALPMA